MRTTAIIRTGVGLAVVGALATGFAPARVSAATATANLAVSATVTTNCTITTAALGFGNYDPVGANSSSDLDGTGTVSVACTKNTAPQIALGLGGNASGTTRRLTDGSSNYLTYELYQDAGRTTIWGTAGAALLSPGAAPSKAARDFTVYGRVASNQDVPAGTFNDTVVATVNF
jgi:spore coat protein U-like protein